MLRMRCFVLVAAILVLTAASDVAAQEQSAAGTPQSADALARYGVERKNEGTAILLEFIPTLGHAYVDDWQRGLAPGVVSVGGFILQIVGAARFDSSLTTVGWLAYLGGRIWGGVSAHQYANEYNAALRARLGLVASQDGGLGLGVAIPTNF